MAIPSWLSLDKNIGSGNGNVTITVEPNNTSQERQAVIDIETGVLIKKLTIKQNKSMAIEPMVFSIVSNDFTTQTMQVEVRYKGKRYLSSSDSTDIYNDLNKYFESLKYGRTRESDLDIWICESMTNTFKYSDSIQKSSSKIKLTAIIYTGLATFRQYVITIPSNGSPITAIGKNSA